MLSYLIVMLERGAVSFCHYGPAAPDAGPRPREHMSVATLERTIALAAEKKLALNVLYGDEPPDAAVENLLERFEAQVKIVPLGLAHRYPEAVVVVRSDADRDRLAELPPEPERNVILRLEKDDLPRLPELLERLCGRFCRLNLVLADIPRYQAGDIDAYRRALAASTPLLIRELEAGRALEVNALTDRILLSAMSNCGAGLTHLTVAPDGGLFACPGFYLAGETDGSAGTVDAPGAPPNPQLFTLAHAPVCSACDAFQCRRCVWLNKTLTREVNTPSREQCVLSHAERAASSALLEALRPLPAFSGLPAIPKLSYDDPLVFLLDQRSRGTGTPINPPARKEGRPAGAAGSDPTERELLLRILGRQDELSEKLDELRRKLDEKRS
jgi:CXXX repeat peptide maturase